MNGEYQNKQMGAEPTRGLDLQGTIRGLFLPIVEFLGILVPGVIFNFSFVFAVIIPLISFIEVFSGSEITGAPIFIDVLKALLTPGMGTLILISVFSYVVGHLFFRQDPKIPDERSFEVVRKTIGDEGPVRLGVPEQKYNKKNNKPNKHNLEFPYRYLKEYLIDRGMDHLATIIPWSGNKPKTYRYRTKHFINTLKVRIEFLFPFQYLRVQRNEAHVRLMSSMWYASNSICFISTIGIWLGLITSFVFIVVNEDVLPYPYMASLVIPVVIYLLSVFLRKHIESFLHYQRIREIVFILETAYLANGISPDFDLSDLHTQKEKLA